MSKYLTFPIAFLNFPETCLKQVIDNAFLYCVYGRCYYEQIDLANFEDAEDYFEITYTNKQKAYEQGRILFEQLNDTPKTSIRIETMWDFYNCEKTEDEIAAFIAFMAIRSIIQKDTCKKITTEYLLSRMAGHAKKCGQIPKWLCKYRERYWIDKLKKNLKLNWGVKMYGRNTRGTYMSFKMTQKELTMFVELRRKRYKERKMAENDEAIRQVVLIEIKNCSKTSANYQHALQQNYSTYK